MRAQRRLALSLLLLAAGWFIVATGAPAMAASGGLTLSPTEGPADTTITATFQVADLQQGAGCDHARVTFLWDRQVIGSKDCRRVVSLAFKPPRNDRASGAHEVIAISGAGTGSATFTITAAGPTGKSTPTPGSTPSTDAASDPPLPVPTDGDTATVAPPSLDAAGGIASPPVNGSSGGGTSLTSVALILGGLLVLGGVGILGFVILRMRRGDLEPEPAGGLSDFPTQSITADYPVVPRPAEPRHAAADPWADQSPPPEDAG